jgi:hypothetical protein
MAAKPIVRMGTSFFQFAGGCRRSDRIKAGFDDISSNNRNDACRVGFRPGQSLAGAQAAPTRTAALDSLAWHHVRGAFPADRRRCAPAGGVAVIAVIVWDRPGPDAAAARTRLLAAHLAHVETIMDRIAVAGPLLGTDGKPTGSLIVLDVETVAAARAIFESDPYFGAGIWQEPAIVPYRAVAGAWVGGKAW